MPFFFRHISLFSLCTLIFIFSNCHKPDQDQPPSTTPDVVLTPERSPYDHTNRGTLSIDSQELPMKLGTRAIKPKWLESSICNKGEFCHQTGQIEGPTSYGAFGNPENDFWMLTNNDQLLHWDGKTLNPIPIGLDTVWSQIDVFPSATPVAWVASSSGDVARCTLSGCQFKNKANNAFGEPRISPKALLATSENTVWMHVIEQDNSFNPIGTYLSHYDGNMWKKFDITSLYASPCDIVQIAGSSETDVWAVLSLRYADKKDFDGQVVLVHFDGTKWTINSSLPSHSLFDPHYVQKTPTDRWLIGNSDHGFHTNSDELTFYQWNDGMKTWKDVTQDINSNFKFPSNLRPIQLKQDKTGNIYFIGLQGKSYQVWIWDGTSWTKKENSADFISRQELSTVLWETETLYILGRDLSLWMWKNNTWTLQWDPDALDDKTDSFSWQPTVFFVTPSRQAWLFFCLDSSQCRLLHGSLDDTEWQEYSSPIINSIWSSQDQDVWFGTSDKGLYHFDGKDFTSYGVSYHILDTSEGYDRFLNQYCGFTKTVYSLRGTSGQDIWAIAGSDNFSEKCLLHFDGSSWAVIKDGPHVLSVWPVEKNNVWASDKTNLWHFDGKVWERRNPGLKNKLSDLSVDKQGNPWFLGDSHVWTLREQIWQQKDLAGNISRQLTADQVGAIWAFNYSGSASRFEASENRWIEQLPPAERAELISNFSLWGGDGHETWLFRSTELYIQKQ